MRTQRSVNLYLIENNNTDDDFRDDGSQTITLEQWRRMNEPDPEPEAA